MIVGGYNLSEDPLRKVEVIDLSGQNQTCDPLPDYPIDYGSVGTFIKDKALVCGGRNSDPAVFFDDCYEFDNQVRLLQSL